MALACEQIRNEFSALLDDELDTEDRELVEEHLSECAECLRELHGFKQVTDAYRYHHPVKAPDDFEARLREAMAPEPVRFTGRWSPMRLAAAAAIVVGIGLAYWRVSEHTGTDFMLSKQMTEDAAESRPQAVEEAIVESEPERMAAEAAPVAEASAETQDGMALARREPTRSLGQADALPEPEAAPSVAADAAPSAAVEMALRDAAAPLDESKEAGAERPAVPAEQDRFSGGFGGGGMRNLGTIGGGGGAFGIEAEADGAVPSENAITESREVAAKMKGSDTLAAKTPAMEPPPASAAPPPQAAPPVSPIQEEAAPMPAEQPAVEREDLAVARRERGREAAASDETTMVSGLVEAETANATLSWRDQSFVLVDGVLQQDGYDGQDTTEIILLSDAWNTVLDKHPDLVDLVDGTIPVIVRLDDVWYRFKPAE